MIRDQWYAVLPSKAVKRGKILGGELLDMDLAFFRSWPVKEKCGIIFLRYGESEKMTDGLPFFDEDIDASWVYSEIEDHWNSHYSRCIENQLDVVHLPFVHYNTIGCGNRLIERQDIRVVITRKPKASAYVSQEKLLKNKNEAG